MAWANLHAIEEQYTDWSQANMKKVQRTDKDRLEAETYEPPPLKEDIK
jgi:hypothetical protein